MHLRLNELLIGRTILLSLWEGWIIRGHETLGPLLMSTEPPIALEMNIVYIYIYIYISIYYQPAWQTYDTFAIVHRKVATNRVMQVALKAAYKILPPLEKQATYARILDMAKKIPNTLGINQEISDVQRKQVL